ncbi:glycosyltransferase [Candidatus Gracilibacteria bacterium]|nr:glycosyltransferase [Candidatus Gracilibacteria bacterium]
MKKMLLFHDTFLMRGGAERMNIELAKAFDADIATATWSRDCYDASSMGFNGEIFETNSNFKKGILGFLKMKWSFFRSKKILKNYTYILFSNEAISGIWNILPGTKTYYYAHSISRHLFDQREDYIKKVPFLLRPAFRLFSLILREIYKKEIAKVGTIFVNSKENQNNMKTLLSRDDAIVIYPSVDTEKFNIFSKKEILQVFAIEGLSMGYKEYYISFSRLTHAKRIDTIIRAFKKNPDKKIVILYGKNDSQKDEFMNLANGYANIIFHELTDNNNLPYVIGGAIASICISKNEDFGMVAI